MRRRRRRRRDGSATSTTCASSPTACRAARSGRRSASTTSSSAKARSVPASVSIANGSAGPGCSRHCSHAVACTMFRGGRSANSRTAPSRSRSASTSSGARHLPRTIDESDGQATTTETVKDELDADEVRGLHLDGIGGRCCRRPRRSAQAVLRPSSGAAHADGGRVRSTARRRTACIPTCSH